MNSTPLPGELYGFRYLVSLATDAPVPTERLAPALSSGGSYGLGWF